MRKRVHARIEDFRTRTVKGNAPYPFTVQTWQWLVTHPWAGMPCVEAGTGLHGECVRP